MGSHAGFGDEREREPEPERPRSFRFLGDYVETTLICAILVVFARVFVFQQAEVPSGSMEDTILIGDYVLVNRFLYAPTSFDWERRLLPIREPRRGDVVVFGHPEETETDFVKRVIGLPGETLALRHGRVEIDGRPLDEPYLDPLYRSDDTFGPIRVERGYYFVLGDNRRHSLDSRSWGFVPRELMSGRAFLVLFSTRAQPSPAESDGGIAHRSLFRRPYELLFRSRRDRVLHPIR